MSLLFNFADAATDSADFGDEITVALDYDYDNGVDPSEGTQITITGSAEFTFERIHFSYFGASDALPAIFSSGLSLAIPKAKFLAYRTSASGMPGWAVLFGSQDNIVGAFTQTTAHDSDTATTMLDASLSGMSAQCTQAAPDRRGIRLFFSDGPGGFFLAAASVGWQAGDVSPAQACSIETLQAGIASTSTSPAIPPVYRVTIPGDPDNLFSTANVRLTANGVNVIGPDPPGDGNPPYYSENDLVTALTHFGTTFRRSPCVCDVQMYNEGDVLDSVSIDVTNLGDQADCKLSMRVGGAFLSKTIDNPFPMKGQGFTFGDDGDGDGDGGDGGDNGDGDGSDEDDGSPDGLTTTVQF